MDNDLKNFTWEVALYNCNEQNPDLEKCAGKIDPTADYKFNNVIYRNLDFWVEFIYYFVNLFYLLFLYIC